MNKKFFWSVVGIVSISFVVLGVRYAFVAKSKRAHLTDTAKLQVLTYPTFMGPFGPGPVLKRMFEQGRDVKVEFINARDSGALVERLKQHPRTDVVIGFDQFTRLEASRAADWRPLAVDLSVRWRQQVVDAISAHFVPVNWSLMTFIYRQDETKPPARLADFTTPLFARSYTLQDPRTSTPGMQFLYWLEVSGQSSSAAEYFKNAHSVSSSWSTAYELFHKGNAQFGFSYVTSLVFHWQEDKDKSYQAVEFAEGHPRQIEYMAVPQSCRHCKLANQFVNFLLRPEAQKIIAEKNFMWPVVEGVTLNKYFAELPELRLMKEDSQVKAFAQKSQSLIEELEAAEALEK